MQNYMAALCLSGQPLRRWVHSTNMCCVPSNISGPTSRTHVYFHSVKCKCETWMSTFTFYTGKVNMSVVMWGPLSQSLEGWRRIEFMTIQPSEVSSKFECTDKTTDILKTQLIDENENLWSSWSGTVLLTRVGTILEFSRTVYSWFILEFKKWIAIHWIDSFFASFCN